MVSQERHGRGDFYDTMQVCVKNGHKITECFDTVPEGHQNNCDQCGSPTTTTCQHCGAKIRGYHHLEHVVGGGRVLVPRFCHNCGKGYPWRKKLKAKKTHRLEIDFKNTRLLFTYVVIPVAVALIGAYIVYKLGWNK